MSGGGKVTRPEQPEGDHPSLSASERTKRSEGLHKRPQSGQRGSLLGYRLRSRNEVEGKP